MELPCFPDPLQDGLPLDFPETQFLPWWFLLWGFCPGLSEPLTLSLPPQLGLLSDIFTMFGVPLLTPTTQPLLTSHLYLFSVSPISPTCQCSFCSILSLLTGFRPSHYLILRGEGPQGDLRLPSIPVYRQDPRLGSISV